MTENILHKPASLLSLVDYGPGAVVSRTLINKKAGTVTLFAFDKEQGLSDHTAPYDALLYVLEGEINVIVDGDSNILMTGAVILMPAGSKHSLKAINKTKTILTMVRQNEE